MRIFLIFILFSITFINCKSNKKTVANKEKEEEKQKNEKQEEESNKVLFDFFVAKELSEVLEKARKQDKWIFMEIGARWCLPCKQMKKDVYTHGPTADFFNKNFILYSVDIEKGEGPDIKIIYQTTKYPTLLFIDSKGREKLRIENGLGISGLMAFGQDALNKKASER